VNQRYRDLLRVVVADLRHTLSGGSNGQRGDQDRELERLGITPDGAVTPFDALPNPTTRLPGSGGANDVGSFCHRTIIIMRQDRRKFAAQLDFLTTPGYLTGPGARERAGLPADTGPHRVITQLGVYGFDDATKAMRLLAVHPGVTVDEVQVNSSFPIPIAEPLEASLAPTPDERRILREIDPTGLLIR
jgi:glutaconate CoA-transferase subunit B